MAGPLIPLPQVRCSECGLLTLRSTVTGIFLEADEIFREDGNRYSPLDVGVGPLCLAMAHDLQAEHQGGLGSPEPQRTQKVIRSDRRCGRFIPWRQGYTPREHLDMHYLDQAKAADADRLREQREWQAEQRRLDQERSDRQHRENVRQRWYLGLLPFALAAVWYLIKDHVEKPKPVDLTPAATARP